MDHIALCVLQSHNAYSHLFCLCLQTCNFDAIFSVRLQMLLNTSTFRSIALYSHCVFPIVCTVPYLRQRECRHRMQRSGPPAPSPPALTRLFNSRSLGIDSTTSATTSKVWTIRPNPPHSHSTHIVFIVLHACVLCFQRAFDRAAACGRLWPTKLICTHRCRYV